MSINVSTLTFFLRASHFRCTQICFPFALLTQLRHVPQLSFRWQGTHFPHAFRFLRATELGFYWKLNNFYLSIVTVETTGHAVKIQKRRRWEREAQPGPTWESGTAGKSWAKSKKNVKNWAVKSLNILICQQLNYFVISGAENCRKKKHPRWSQYYDDQDFW